MIEQLPLYKHLPNLAKLLKKLIKEKRKFDKGYNLPSDLYVKMTITQMIDLSDAFPQVRQDKHFVSNLFSKNFPDSNTTFKLRETDLTAYYSSLAEQYLWLVEQDFIYASFKQQILTEMLIIGPKIGIYDKELFIMMLENPINPYNAILETHNKKLR